VIETCRTASSFRPKGKPMASIRLAPPPFQAPLAARRDFGA
jgi:hypothetical protein